tara:strand:+ start:1793 stop:2275 length:483 start_codon:yes stop_codon:yes gene_type:complete
MAKKKTKKEKHETVSITSKDLVILRFPSEWPVTEADLQAMMKTVRTAINQDSTIVKRFVCMAKGMEIETLKEEQFIQIWQSKFGDESFKKANEEDPNQLDLFPQEPINPDSMESVLENVIPSEEKKSVEIDVKLDKPDEDGNSWKAIDEDTYEKVQRGEL